MKDRECIRCEKFFDCKGKGKPTPCLNFQERKTDEQVQKPKSSY